MSSPFQKGPPPTSTITDLATLSHAYEDQPLGRIMPGVEVAPGALLGEVHRRRSSLYCCVVTAHGYLPIRIYFMSTLDTTCRREYKVSRSPSRRTLASRRASDGTESPPALPPFPSRPTPLAAPEVEARSAPAASNSKADPLELLVRVEELQTSHKVKCGRTFIADIGII